MLGSTGEGIQLEQNFGLLIQEFLCKLPGTGLERLAIRLIISFLVHCDRGNSPGLYSDTVNVGEVLY